MHSDIDSSSSQAGDDVTSNLSTIDNKQTNINPIIFMSELRGDQSNVKIAFMRHYQTCMALAVVLSPTDRVDHKSLKFDCVCWDSFAADCTNAERYTYLTTLPPPA